MGNKVGWIISGILVVVLVLIVVFTVVFPGHSGPSLEIRREGFLDLKQVDVPVSEVLGFTPNAEGNAADDYHKAVELYQTKQQEIDSAVEQQRLPGMLLARTIREIHTHVARGAAKQKMQYTLTHAPKEFLVRFMYDPDPADTLEKVSQGLRLLAKQQLTKKNYPEVEQILQHCFLLGWGMIQERARPYMVMRGMDVQGMALLDLEELYEHWETRPERLKAIPRYLRELEKLSNFYESKSKIFRSLRPHPGDIFHIIENDEDRAWRVQGLLVLGILKFRTERTGDLKYARKLMNKYATSSDALEAAAATAAKNLTREQYRTLGRDY